MKLKQSLSSLLLLGALSPVCSAAVISVNFNNGSATTNVGSSETAGVVAASSWNNFVGNSTSGGTNLLNDSGVATTVDFTRPAAAGDFQNGSVDLTSPDNKLMNGYTDVGGTAVTWTFSDLNVSGFTTYDVIVYTAGGANSGRFGDYTIGATTIRSTDLASFDSAGAGFIESTGTSGTSTNGNYVRFSGVTGDSFALSAVGANAGTPRAPVNGIQIIAVPEPSSAALLGLAGLTLISRRRR